MDENLKKLERAVEIGEQELCDDESCVFCREFLDVVLPLLKGQIEVYKLADKLWQGDY